jgi:capsular polysaccharide biosynthesis protein
MVNIFQQVVSVGTFDRSIAAQSPLYARLASQQADPNWPLTDLRANLKSTASGPLLVTVTYSAKNTAVGMEVLRTFFKIAPRELEVLNHRAVNPNALRIADPPSPASSTSSKKKLLLNLGIVFAVGVLLGGTFVVARTALDRSVRYGDEVPKLLGLPVLGIVPYTRTLNNGERGR